MIPPSLGLIIYAALAQVSVGALFVATHRSGPADGGRAVDRRAYRDACAAAIGERSARAELAASAGTRSGCALPALVLPLLIVGGIRYGAFSATEAGAVAALYAVLCGVFIYRAADGATLLQALREALAETATVMVVIAASAPFAFALIIEQVPQKLAAAMATLTGSWVLLLLVINVFLLFVGLAMEMIASMVILVPLLVPLLKAANIDLVHFGVVMVGNLCIGALTPPLAVLVFTAARVTDTPIHLAYRACRPFMVGAADLARDHLVHSGAQPLAGASCSAHELHADRGHGRAADRRLGGRASPHAAPRTSGRCWRSRRASIATTSIRCSRRRATR